MHSHRCAGNHDAEIKELCNNNNNQLELELVLCCDIDNGMKTSLAMTSWLQLNLNGAQNIKYIKYGDDMNIAKQQLRNSIIIITA